MARTVAINWRRMTEWYGEERSSRQDRVSVWLQLDRLWRHKYWAVPLKRKIKWFWWVISGWISVYLFSTTGMFSRSERRSPRRHEWLVRYTNKQYECDYTGSPAFHRYEFGSGFVSFFCWDFFLHLHHSWSQIWMRINSAVICVDLCTVS